MKGCSSILQCGIVRHVHASRLPRSRGAHGAGMPSCRHGHVLAMHGAQPSTGRMTSSLPCVHVVGISERLYSFPPNGLWFAQALSDADMVAPSRRQKCSMRSAGGCDDLRKIDDGFGHGQRFGRGQGEGQATCFDAVSYVPHDARA
jgi:hypothetical protein